MLDFTLDDLFKEDVENTENVAEPLDGNDTDNTEKPTTDAISKRINEVKEKTEKETQNKIAKDLGYDSYEDMKNASNKKEYENAGIDDDQTIELIEKLIQKRLADDPRFKKLEEFEKRERDNFVVNELNEINKLTGNKYTSVEQLPKDTLTLWEKTGNLKQAYLATEGEALLLKKTAMAKKGDTLHLTHSGNGGNSTKTRALTEKEKEIWRSVMPDITDEELNSKTTEIKD